MPEAARDTGAAPHAGTLRILLIGFAPAQVEALRRAARSRGDTDLRLYSRRSTDAGLSRSSRSAYERVIIAPGETLVTPAQLHTLAPDASVLIAGPRGASACLALLRQPGAEHWLAADCDDPAQLLAVALRAGVARNHQVENALQREVLHSLEHALGHAPGDEEPIVILGDGNHVSFANRAAQALGAQALSRMIEHVSARRMQPPDVLISGVDDEDNGIAPMTITATRTAVEDRGVTILRVRQHQKQRLGDLIGERTLKLDPITGLPNRSVFVERAEALCQAAAAESRRGGLLLIDLDHMRGINESLGYDNGNALLNVVGQRIRYCLRGNDWVGHLGGDSYAVLLHEARNTEDISRVCEKVLAEIGQTVQLDSGPLTPSASIGIAVAEPGETASVTTLLHQADLAGKRAASRGGNTYEFFDASLGARVRRGWELLSALREALPQRQYALVYQPVVDPQGRILGSEALLRWQHPKFGAVSPAEFVPVLEQSGLIHEVGEWVLRSACAQAAQWRRAGQPSLFVSVNLSPKQILREDLPQRVRAILSETALPAQNLALEITENVLLDRTDFVIERLEALKALGLRLYIDDFGTGFSSIAYLKRLPVTGLKIDRAFVSGIDGDGRDRALVKAMVELARAVSLGVVAEGVETREQTQRLGVLGVDHLQGFLYSPGVGAADFSALLDRQQPLPA